MATTQNTFTGNGSNLGPFSFTFKWLESTDIKVTVGGVLKTAGTHYNLQSLNYTTKTGGQVLFTAGNAPANGASIRIYRDTDDEALSAVFSSGSAIRAKDLNDNFTQNLYVTQEIANNSVNIDGSNPMVGNLNLNNFKAINLGTPTVATDASTKGYVDSVIATGAANAAAAASSASAAAGSATAAANSLDSFDDRYLGAKTTDPSVDNDGNALLVGAIYFNSTSKVMRVWNGANWQDSSANANVLRWRKTAVGGETTLSGNDNSGQSLIYTVNLETVFLNGALLQRGVDYVATTGNSITGLVALTAGDVVEVLAFSQVSLLAIPSSTVTFTQSGTGSTQRTVESKLKDVVSVKDFGAVCDGTTNDAPAVQAAINHCLTYDPPAVLVVPGLCRLDNTVNINRGKDAVNASTFFRIRGDGSGAGFYAYSGLNMFSTTLTTGNPNDLTASQKIHFDNITFKSEFPSNPTYVLDDAKFLRMRFTNCDFHRIKLLNATRFLQTYYLDNCTAYGWLGTFINGTNGSYDIKIDNFIAEAGDTFFSVVCNDVYSGDPNAQVSITNSLFQTMRTGAIVADRCQGFVVENCYFEGNSVTNGAPDIKFDTARNLANLAPNGSIVVTGCFFSQLLANFNNPSYYSVRWGRTTVSGFAAGNYLVDLATGVTPLRLHYTIPESRVTFLGETGYIQGHFSEFVYAAGGYVMPGTGGERLRMIRGQVESSGAISAGTGFTVNRSATGTYDITIQTAFSALPSAVASAADSNGRNISTLVNMTSSSTFSVVMFNELNVLTNSKFNFIVMGPA